MTTDDRLGRAGAKGAFLPRAATADGETPRGLAAVAGTRAASYFEETHDYDRARSIHRSMAKSPSQAVRERAQLRLAALVGDLIELAKAADERGDTEAAAELNDGRSSHAIAPLSRGEEELGDQNSRVPQQRAGERAVVIQRGDGRLVDFGREECGRRGEVSEEGGKLQLAPAAIHVG